MSRSHTMPQKGQESPNSVGKERSFEYVISWPLRRRCEGSREFLMQPPFNSNWVRRVYVADDSYVTGSSGNVTCFLGMPRSLPKCIAHWMCRALQSLLSLMFASVVTLWYSFQVAEKWSFVITNGKPRCSDDFRCVTAVLFLSIKMIGSNCHSFLRVQIYISVYGFVIADFRKFILTVDLVSDSMNVRWNRSFGASDPMIDRTNVDVFHCVLKRMVHNVLLCVASALNVHWSWRLKLLQVFGALRLRFR